MLKSHFNVKLIPEKKNQKIDENSNYWGVTNLGSNMGAHVQLCKNDIVPHQIKQQV
jgi:hypothetical protein